MKSSLTTTAVLTLICLCSMSSAFARDVGIIGQDRNLLIFEKDGYIYRRVCKQYEYLKNRKTCSNFQELRFEPTKVFEERLFGLMADEVKYPENDKRDPRITYQGAETLMSPKEFAVEKKKLDAMLAQKASFGDKSVKPYLLETLQNQIKFNENNQAMRKILIEEAAKIMSDIKNKNIISLDGPALTNIGNIVLSRFMNYESFNGYEEYPEFTSVDFQQSNCKFSDKKKDNKLEILLKDQVIGTCTRGSYADYFDCQTKLKVLFKKKICVYKPSAPKNKLRNVTHDAAISNDQRAIIKKDPTLTTPTASPTPGDTQAQ